MLLSLNITIHNTLLCTISHRLNDKYGREFMMYKNLASRLPCDVYYTCDTRQTFNY